PIPGWFKALLGLITLPFSYALRPEFYIQDDLLPNLSVPLIEHKYGTSCSKKLWIATTSCRIGKHALDAPPDENSIRSSDLVIGRSLRIAPDTSLVLSHWLYTNDDSSPLTPRSSKLILRPCPGCQHNTTSIKRSKSLVKAAHGANCWFYASTYWSIWIPSLPVKKFSSVIFLNISFYYLSSLVISFCNRFSDFLVPLGLNDLVNGPVSDEPSTSDIVIMDDNDYRFYTDGSVLNFKSPSVAAHSDNDLNNRADALAKDHLTSSSTYEPDFTRLQDVLPMIPRFNNIYIDFDLRSLVKMRYEQIQFLNFCSLQRFARQAASASLYSWKAIWGFFRFSLYHGASTNFKSHNFTIFRLKILFDRLPTLCLRKRDAPDLYPMDDTCPLCNVNPETLLHVWTCTAPHNLYCQPDSLVVSSVFYEYLDCFKHNLRKKLSLYFKKHKTPDSVIALDLGKFDALSIWDLSLLNSLPLPLSPTAHDL
ncbi:hypothetical protein RhiirC2_800290, partial [Rhizophagus irregularis]